MKPALVLVLYATLACALGVGPQGWPSDQGPVVPHDTFPAQCDLCHETGSWHRLKADFQFDHAKETGVALEGAHAQAQCLRCHNDRGPVRDFAKRGCAGCHVDPHEGQLGRRCADCHDQRTWVPHEQVARHGRTRFPLAGAHAAAACWRCHPGAQVGNFARADIRCESCHQDDLARATSPDHAAQSWVRDCQRCHIPTAWAPARFTHGAFPLVGQHAAARCAQCHPGDRFRGTPNQCVTCHQDAYDRTSDPDHRTAGFSTDCALCHTAHGWEPARFAHASWALSGAHAGASCNTCHAGNVYRGTPRDCVSCHQSAYDAAKNPDHRAAKLPTTCDTCHGTSTWKGARFDHRFPLTSGKHAGFECADCHTTPGDYKRFSCIDCHEHRQAKMNDEHKEVNGYAWTTPSCLSCHPDGRKR